MRVTISLALKQDQKDKPFDRKLKLLGELKLKSLDRMGLLASNLYTLVLYVRRALLYVKQHNLVYLSTV